MNRRTRDHFIGCLLAGAIGDALGWPVEFDEIEEIVRDYGANGITNLVVQQDGLAQITDDTQMTLFTAEGLLRAWATSRHLGSTPDFSEALWISYSCWLQTQDSQAPVPDSAQCHYGWLLAIEQLHHRRAPGNTCLSALREGSLLDNGIINNTSKGCGGVMRSAPAGLLAVRINQGGDITGTARLAFEIGCTTAKLTHGHPSGFYPAGVLAAVIAVIIMGGSIEEGISISLDFLDDRICAKETIDALTAAVTLWKDKQATPSPKTIETLGGGWVGEEALAISLYCSLVCQEDLVKALQLAVNHSGDSDSTGSITGNILGALLGEQAIPKEWLEQLELADTIRQVGDDLFTIFEGTESWLRKYPPI
jgi:ADP-ribosylglycohydrolase